MDFRVGQKVRVVEEFTWLSVMIPKIGTVGKVVEIIDKDIVIEFENGNFITRIALNNTKKVKPIMKEW